MEVKDFLLKIPLKIRKINGRYQAYYPGWEVSAEGDTEEEARIKAREAAAKKLDAFMTNEIPPNSRRPQAEFWKHKTADELAEEQGIKPIKDEEDLSERIIGGLEEWDDIDEFIKEIHKPWEEYAR